MEASAERLLKPTKDLADHEDEVDGSAEFAVVLLSYFRSVSHMHRTVYGYDCDILRAHGVIQVRQLRQEQLC